jgi:20S proteasome alpha/beta subunit
MTVVLAVACAEGVVIASDGQATDMSGGNLAVATKSTVQKLFTLGDHVAWGATGSGGLIQRFDDRVRKLDPKSLELPIENLRQQLAEEQRAMQRQAVSEVVQGVPGSNQAPTVAPLFAGYTSGQPWILEVTAAGEDTVYDETYAVGSGGVFAKQAMAAIAHYDFPKRSLDETKVIAWRALDDCIASSAFGIGHPIRIISVEAGGLTELDDDELRSIKDSVNAWKQEELDALGRLGLGRSPEPEGEDEGLSPEPEAEPESAKATEKTTDGGAS